jgi:hypothetical protein
MVGEGIEVEGRDDRLEITHPLDYSAAIDVNQLIMAWEVIMLIGY